ncbi:MAG: hypothetical protein QOK22_1473, partial [Gaiellaceae bacterium]|nr:hypothetical protein [Gaiellaceae bacterium]
MHAAEAADAGVPVLQQRSKAVGPCQIAGTLALVVRDSRVCATLEQELDELLVVILRGGVQGGKAAFSLAVDVCAGIEQE